MTRSIALAALCLTLVSLRAAAAAKWSFYFQATLTDARYQRTASERIQKHWHAPKARPEPGKKTVVRTVIGRDGALRSNELHLSSGSKAWDEAVLAATRAAAPFRPLPPGYPYDTFEIDSHVAP